MWSPQAVAGPISISSLLAPKRLATCASAVVRAALHCRVFRLVSVVAVSAKDLAVAVLGIASHGVTVAVSIPGAIAISGAVAGSTETWTTKARASKAWTTKAWAPKSRPKARIVAAKTWSTVSETGTAPAPKARASSAVAGIRNRRI